VNGLALFSEKAGTAREALLKRFFTLAADRSPLVSHAAEAALAAYHVPREVIMHDVLLYGEHRKPPVVALLHAGPISVKFQDGELRYLSVGEKEIARRIYFAVRDERWDTVMPEFESIDVQQTAYSFHITMKAVCRNDVADYRWSGEIVGTEAGKDHLSPSPGRPTPISNRRASASTCSTARDRWPVRRMKLVDEKGTVTPGAFPKKLSRTACWRASTLFARCATHRRRGMTVSAGLAGQNFGMEDQRNFGRFLV